MMRLLRRVKRTQSHASVGPAAEPGLFHYAPLLVSTTLCGKRMYGSRWTVVSAGGALREEEQEQTCRRCLVGLVVHGLAEQVS